MLQFTHNNDRRDVLSVTTDQKVVLEIFFDGIEAEWFQVDGHEFDKTDDTLRGLYFIINGEFIGALDVISQAEDKIENFLDDAHIEGEYEDDVKFTYRSGAL